MSPTDDALRQNEEIQALKAIFEDDFTEKPQKAWKGATPFHDFSILVKHSASHLKDKFKLQLNISLPKTYPSRAVPTVTIINPVGLSAALVSSITSSLKHEIQNMKGNEMLFQIVTFCQEEICKEYPESKYPQAAGSLAVEMKNRTNEMQKAKASEIEDMLQIQKEKEMQVAAQVASEMRHNAERKEALQRQEKEQMKLRNRSISNATELAPSGELLEEKFDEPVRLGQLSFTTVELSQPKQGNVGTVYRASPVVDTEQLGSPPLELLMVIFSAAYYQESHGWKKLQEIGNELRLMTQTNHQNLQNIYAYKLVPRKGRSYPRLSVLMESSPEVSMKDILDASGYISPDRAKEFFRQILHGVMALHDHNIIHRNLSTETLGVSRIGKRKTLGEIKILGASYVSRIAALNRSNPFGDITILDTPPWPEEWLSKEMVESPSVYNYGRDLYHVGIVVLEMVNGLEISSQHSRPSLAAASLSEGLREAVLALINSRRNADPGTILDILDAASEKGGKGDSLTIKTLSAPSHDPMPKTPTQGSMPLGARHGSRYRNEWEELDFLGSGGFGAVVKARNKLDGRVYAVKKVRLRPSDKDAKIFREVTALAKLSHRFIVRYYTSWIEISDGGNTPSDEDESGSSLENIDDTVKTISKSTSRSDIFQVDLNDLTRQSSRHDSFPGIYFADNSNDVEDSDDSSDDSDSDEAGQHTITVSTRLPASTLYIQMEYVENLTLKERIAAGLDEAQAWKLFYQLLDALVYMSSLGILHRDIKLGNIFIDSNGDCKIGDFGLATSSKVNAEGSTMSSSVRSVESDMTMDVGTRLYVAPELLAQPSSKVTTRSHSKADMFSLGIVFFEMNFRFQTGAERVAVLEKLRDPLVVFPAGWEAHKVKQREIVNLLLQHDVSARPSALELSQSPLLPPRVEDESLNAALQSMAKVDSPHYATVINKLFSQEPKVARSLTYDDQMEQYDHAALEEIVSESVRDVFRLHGAVLMEPQLLLPVMKNQLMDSAAALLLDRQGDLVMLPKNLLLPFARLAMRTNTRRIKRYFIGNVYRAALGGGHPDSVKAAVFDIITPSIIEGAESALAECMLIAIEIMKKFPGLTRPPYDVRLSNASVASVLFNDMKETLRTEALDVLCQAKATFPQKRAALTQLGLSRPLVDEIEILSTSGTSCEGYISRLNKLNSPRMARLRIVLQEMDTTSQFANGLGLGWPIIFLPFNCHQRQFSEGASFEITKGKRRTDVLCAGGRYDNMINDMRSASVADPGEPLRSVGLQISLDRITTALAAFQSGAVKNWVKEQRSFGYWSPRRCDVYVISHQPGQLHDRLEIVSFLWNHGVSADFMYEQGVHEGAEAIHQLCLKEGILFTVQAKSKSARTGLPMLKVTSTLSREEQEVSRSELILFIQQRINDQRKADLSTTGISSTSQLANTATAIMLSPVGSEVQLLLPPDKKQLKHNKNLLMDKSFEMAMRVKRAMGAGLPTIAVHVSPASFGAMTSSNSWLSDDDGEAFKRVVSTFAPPVIYATQIRDALLRRKEEGQEYVLLISLKDEKIHLLSL